MWFRSIKNWFRGVCNSISFWWTGLTGNTRNPQKMLQGLIDRQKVCYIGSIDEDGFPNTKAMLRPRKRNGLKEFFLSTNTSSQKVAAFRKNSKACLYFCDRKFTRGVMFKGKVEVLEDQDSKTMLWEKRDNIYYPEGVNDPDYCVLKFIAASARYYQNLKSVDLEISSTESELAESTTPDADAA